MSFEAPPNGPAETDQASLRTSVARGGIWSIIGQGAGLLAALFVAPVTIRLLGPTRYGLWALLQSALGWVGLADFGMSVGSTRLAGESYAQRDNRGEANAVWTAALISAVLTSVVAGAVAAAAPFVVKQLLHVRPDAVGAATVAMRLTCAGCVAGVIVGTANTPLLLRQQWRSFTVIGTGSAVLQTIAIPVMLELFGGGVVTAAIVSLSTSILSACGMIYAAVRLQPAMRRPRVERGIARKLLAFGGALTVAGVASIVLTSAERLLLAHYKSTADVAYYAVAARLGTLLWVIPTAIVQPLFPALVTMHGRGDADAARSLYRQALQATFLLLTPLLVLVAFIAHPFLSVWAGPVYGRRSTVPFFIILGGVWFNSIAWLPATYLTAVVRPSFIARIHVSEVVPYVVAAAILTSAFGAIGAAAVWSARVAIDAVIFSWAARRTAGVTASPLSSHAFRSATAPIALGAVLYLLASQTSALAIRVGYGATLAALYSALVWLLVLSDSERRGLRSLAATVTPFKHSTPTS